MVRLIAVVVAAVTLAACNNITTTPTSPSTRTGVVVTPGGLPTPLPSPGTDTIEYRVTGTPTGALVRYSTSLDGLSQLTTTLPYVLSFESTRASIFLSLEATPIATAATTVYPFLAVQIFVNGALFREASTTTTYSGAVSVSGTWRR